MSIYTISDLHLSLGMDKPMDIFGNNWKNHEKKIRDNWIKKVKVLDWDKLKKKTWYYCQETFLGRCI